MSNSNVALWELSLKKYKPGYGVVETNYAQQLQNEPRYPFKLLDALQVTCADSLLLDVTMSGGSYIYEVSWTLQCSDGSSLSGGNPFSGSLRVVRGSECTLEMRDSYGDGWTGGVWHSLNQTHTLQSGEHGSAFFVIPALHRSCVCRQVSPAIETISLHMVTYRCNTFDELTIDTGYPHEASIFIDEIALWPVLLKTCRAVLSGTSTDCSRFIDEATCEDEAACAWSSQRPSCYPGNGNAENCHQYKTRRVCLNNNCVWRTAHAPPHPGSKRPTCSAFRHGREAREWYSYYYPFYGDVARLDPNGNGIPCDEE